MQKRILVISNFVIMILAICGIIIYFLHGGQAEREYNQIRESKSSLVSLWEKNNDLVGWIKIPNTGIDYPIMRGEKYLHENLNNEYSESGTPFVQDDWTKESLNTIIYGHNMWVQKTMFNPLHKYEDETYWLQHKQGTLYVLEDSPEGGKKVKKRNFNIEQIIKASTKDDFPWQTYTNISSNKTLQEYLDWCMSEEMHESGITRPTGYGIVTLCTCSYHIKGDRHAGRLLCIGHVNEVN